MLLQRSREIAVLQHSAPIFPSTVSWRDNRKCFAGDRFSTIGYRHAWSRCCGNALLAAYRLAVPDGARTCAVTDGKL